MRYQEINDHACLKSNRWASKLVEQVISTSRSGLISEGEWVSTLGVYVYSISIYHARIMEQGQRTHLALEQIDLNTQVKLLY